MTDPKERKGKFAFGHRPPTKIFLGIAVGLLALNHLFVVFGQGVSPELLCIGCWFGLLGVWVGVAGRSFELVEGWAKRSMRRELGVGLLTFAIAIGLAEAIAWFGYKQHLVN